MADRKMSAFAAITAAGLADNDLIPVVDVSAGAVDAGNKVLAWSELKTMIFNGGIAVVNTVAGTANAITGALSFGVPTDGNFLTLIPTLDNTGAVTLALTGDSARAIQDSRGLALGAGRLFAGRIYLLKRIGTVYRLVTEPKYETGLPFVTAMTGTADAIAGSLSFGIPTDGQLLVLTPTADNTGAVTLNLTGDAARSVRDASGALLGAGRLLTGRNYILRRNSSLYNLVTEALTQLDANSYGPHLLGTVTWISDQALTAIAPSKMNPILRDGQLALIVFPTTNLNTLIQLNISGGGNRVVRDGLDVAPPVGSIAPGVTYTMRYDLATTRWRIIGGTINAQDRAYVLDRANHTGKQKLPTVIDAPHLIGINLVAMLNDPPSRMLEALKGLADIYFDADTLPLGNIANLQTEGTLAPLYTLSGSGAVPEKIAAGLWFKNAQFLLYKPVTPTINNVRRAFTIMEMTMTVSLATNTLSALSQILANRSNLTGIQFDALGYNIRHIGPGNIANDMTPQIPMNTRHLVAVETNYVEGTTTLISPRDGLPNTVAVTPTAGPISLEDLRIGAQSEFILHRFMLFTE